MSTLNGIITDSSSTYAVAIGTTGPAGAVLYASPLTITSGSGIAASGAGLVGVYSNQPGAYLNNQGGVSSADQAGYAVFFTAAATNLTVINSGNIYGSSKLLGSGVFVNYGYVKTNAVSGGYQGGVFLQSGTLVNHAGGYIYDSAYVGDGTIENYGRIRNGVAFGDQGTLINSGVLVESVISAGTLTVDNRASGGPPSVSALHSLTLVNYGQIGNRPGSYNPSFAVSADQGDVINHGTIGAEVISGLFGRYPGPRYGVALNSTNFSTVANYGTIMGYYSGVREVVGTLINSGSIAAHNRGVDLFGGPGLSNSGRITADYFGVYDHDVYGRGTVDNAGTIGAAGASGVGVFLKNGGVLTNAGTIGGSRDAVLFAGNGADRVIVDPGATFIGNVVGGNGSNTLELAATTNTGTISGLGISFQNFGTVTVDSGAIWVLSGSSTIGPGATLDNLGTLTDTGHLTNAGTISGSGVLLVDPATLTNSGSIGLTVTLAGDSHLDNTVTGTIVAAGSGVYGTGGANTVVNAGSIAGGGVGGIGVGFVSGGTVIDSGTISGAGGTAVYLGGTGNNLLALEHGYMLAGAAVVAGSGNALELLGAAGAVTADLDKSGAGFTNFGTIGFGAAAGNPLTLQIDGTAMPSNILAGFTVGDTVDLTGIVDGLVTNGTIGADNVLSVTDTAGNPYTLQFDPTQNFAGQFFHTAPDAGGGTLLTASETPCVCRGTMILTESGNVPVEALTVGDKVMTIAGEAKPIHWIGHGRRVLTGENPEARPLIVRADAIAEGMPLRDLYLTRGHSLYLDGMLIPVEFLVNERSILWDDNATEVEFYHIELEDHDVLLADGAPAESYRDDGNRTLFDNPEPPVFAAANMAHFAPVLMGGPEVDRIWRELLDGSGFTAPEATDDPDLHLLADGERIDPIAIEDRRDGWQGIYRFRVDTVPVDLALASAVCVPMRMGLNHDPRRLGVAIRAMTLNGDEARVDLPCTSPLLTAGFHHPEPEPRHRWTTGQAVLPRAALTLFDGPFDVLVQVVCTARYPLVEEGVPTAHVVARNVA